jgi:hypothetical protein
LICLIFREEYKLWSSSLYSQEFMHACELSLVCHYSTTAACLGGGVSRQNRLGVLPGSRHSFLGVHS